jgi:hypothetical protein
VDSGIGACQISRLATLVVGSVSLLTKRSLFSGISWTLIVVVGLATLKSTLELRRAKMSEGELSHLARLELGMSHLVALSLLLVSSVSTSAILFLLGDHSMELCDHVTLEVEALQVVDFVVVVGVLRLQLLHDLLSHLDSSALGEDLEVLAISTYFSKEPIVEILSSEARVTWPY